MEQFDVVIIGAGLAGLQCARRLSQTGHRILLVDHKQKLNQSVHTTGIFVRIAAEAAEEDREQGRKRITPYWRVVKDDGTFNPKLPGGPAQQTLNLRDEGFEVSTAGKKNHRVVDFANRLIKFK